MIPYRMNPLGINEYLPLTLTALEDSSTVSVNIGAGSPVVSGLQYRKRGRQWTSYTIGTEIQLNANQYVQFRNTASCLSTSGSDFARFVLTGAFNADGDVMSMLNNVSACGAFCFYGLFSRTSTLKRPPEMPCLNLAQSCYDSMFYNSGILEPPKLPALQMATNCYQSMFSGCGNMRHGPVLPAMQLAYGCYAYMCQRTVFPSIQLPATTLTDLCYIGMLSNNRHLTAIVLPATALTDYCYQSMLGGCSSLTSVEVAFTSWRNTADTSGWLSSVAASGTFIKPAALPVDSSSPIPSGWTIVNK